MATAQLIGPSDVYILADGTELIKDGPPAEVDDETAAALAGSATDNFRFEDFDPDAIDATEAAHAKATELGVDISIIKGTGKDGRITVQDVEAAQPAETVEGPPIGGDLSNDARTAGGAPHAMLADEVDPHVEENPGKVGVGSKSATGDNSRNIDESDSAREAVRK